MLTVLNPMMVRRKALHLTLERNVAQEKNPRAMHGSQSASKDDANYTTSSTTRTTAKPLLAPGKKSKAISKNNSATTTASEATRQKPQSQQIHTQPSRSTPTPKHPYPTLSPNETLYPPKPAPSFPPGWTQRIISHNAQGKPKRRPTILFYSPQLQIKFRSKKKALQFAELVSGVADGEEIRAWEWLIRSDEVGENNENVVHEDGVESGSAIERVKSNIPSQYQVGGAYPAGTEKNVNRSMDSNF